MMNILNRIRRFFNRYFQFLFGYDKKSPKKQPEITGHDKHAFNSADQKPHSHDSPPSDEPVLSSAPSLFKEEKNKSKTEKKDGIVVPINKYSADEQVRQENIFATQAHEELLKSDEESEGIAEVQYEEIEVEENELEATGTSKTIQEYDWTSENEDSHIAFDNEEDSGKPIDNKMGKTSDVIQTRFVQIEKPADIHKQPGSQFDRYYRSFLYQRERSEVLSEEEVRKYLLDLQNDRFEQFSVMSLQTIEQILFSLTMKMDLIGELPISEKCFRTLVEVTRALAKKKGRLDPKSVPPTLFMTLMVFCARYSHEEASKFWEPYVQEVWGKNSLTQAFQAQCRKHFINCRRDLKVNQGKLFYFYTEGGVVRPVYQHAIIPYYLESDFIRWMINNFEEILKYSADDLARVLAKDESIKTFPFTFQHFITDKDTSETAASLIRNIALAVKRFQLTQRVEEVASLMDSMIAKALFKKIIQEILSKATGQEQLRSYSSRLQWVWIPEEQTLGLRLSNFKAPAEEKPDFVVCAIENTVDLINSQPSQNINPWRSPQGDTWEIDSVIFTENIPLQGYVYVLSEAYNVRNPEEQDKHILFKRRIPSITSDFLCFKVDTNRHHIIVKNEIDSEGTWLIFSRRDYEIFSTLDVPLEFKQEFLIRVLKSEGYINARQYVIDFPISISFDGKHKIINRSQETKLSYSIVAERMVPGLSKNVLPVFLNNNIKLKLHNTTGLKGLERIWLSIMVNREFQQSISLHELYKDGKIEKLDNFFLIDISSFIMGHGEYSFDVLFHLQSLLDESAQFVVLKESIKITPPDPDPCYSPNTPPSIKIKGVSQKNIINEQSEKTKVLSIEDGVQIAWPMVKSSSPGIILGFDGYNVHLRWPIKRVSAWIEALTDTNKVMKGEEKKVNIFIRGVEKQRYQFRLKESGLQIDGELDAKGNFTRKLSEFNLYDLLRESKRVTTTVEISMDGISWKLFQYISIPDLQITKDTVLYSLSQGLVLDFEALEVLDGEYELLIMDQKEKILFAKKYRCLNKKMNIPVDLIPGKYTLEIVADGNSVCLVEGITVEYQIPNIKDKDDIIIRPGQSVNKDQLFQSFTAPLEMLIQLQNQRGQLISILNQLVTINLRDTWINDKLLEDCFINLLPAWAVTKYPMQFESIGHRRKYHVFPERLVFGGMAGQGSINLKIGGEKLRTYVAWKPSNRATIAEMWVSFPQAQVNTKYSEVDPLSNWPGYLCLDCGEIVGHEHGTYLNFPPSIVNAHLHGKERRRTKQFIDTVYSINHKLLVKIDFYEGELLQQGYSAKEIIGNFKNTDQTDSRKINVPVDGFSTHDFQVAYAELSRCLQDPIEKFRFTEVLSHTSQLDLVVSYINGQSFKYVPISSFNRLFNCFNSQDTNIKIIKIILLLGLLIRMKAHKSEVFETILKDGYLTVLELIDLTHLFYSYCPKMLEWALAWVEIFFVHSIS